MKVMRNIDLNTPDPGELDPGRRAAPAHDTSANLPSLEMKRKDDYGIFCCLVNNFLKSLKGTVKSCNFVTFFA